MRMRMMKGSGEEEEEEEEKREERERESGRGGRRGGELCPVPSPVSAQSALSGQEKYEKRGEEKGGGVPKKKDVFLSYCDYAVISSSIYGHYGTRAL